MNSFNQVLLNRKKLYDEIWELSVAGVAKKYNLHYAKLINSLKENNIPYPPSGYWTRLACGKDVSSEVVPLPKSDIQDIYLYMAGYSAVKKKKNEEKVKKEKWDETLKSHEEYREGNIVATYKKEYDKDGYILPFLKGEEREQVINALTNIEVKPNSRLHPVLVAYKKSIQEWKRKEKESQYSVRRNSYDYNMRIKAERPPFLNELSEEGINRVLAILDALYKVIEGLGGIINSDFSVQIRSDVVGIGFAEAQDKKEHELTKQEAKELLEYKEKLKFHQYASKPQIKKYDYFYNGKLRIKFDNGKYIRDNEQQKLEERLDEILIELYEISEEYRIKREKREREHQEYLEKERREEERVERIMKEKQKTQALANEARDYQIASEIRNYIQAVSDKADITTEEQEWIKWAKDKADWYDPVISHKDKYLGKRKHAASEEEKQLKNEIRRGGYIW